MLRVLVLGLLVLLTVVAVACGGATPTELPDASPTATPTPNIPATVAAEVQATIAASSIPAPTATPTPEPQAPLPTATPVPPPTEEPPAPELILPASVTTVQLVPGSASLLEGETRQLDSVVAGGAGDQLTGRPVACSSSNSAVARVSAAGLGSPASRPP
jgi:hypothetical protein